MAEVLNQKAAPKGLNALWITPLRALAVEIQQATQRMTSDLLPNQKIGLRTGTPHKPSVPNKSTPHLAW